MMQVKKTFYLLKSIRVVPRTEEDIQEGFELYKVKYGKNRTLEGYKTSLKNWEDCDYVYDEMILSFFLEESEAINAALSNVVDYNDVGVYNYSAVIEYPVGVSYFDIYPISIRIYKYNRDSKLYTEVIEDTSPEVQLIIKKNIL